MCRQPFASRPLRRLLWPTLLAAALSASCVRGAEEPGRLDICFHTPDDPQRLTDEDDLDEVEETVEATVVYDKHGDDVLLRDAPLDCRPTRVIHASRGERSWYVGYRLLNSEGHDITPALGLEVGQAINITLARWRLSSGPTYHGLAISDPAQLLLTMSKGPQWDRQVDNFAGLLVRRGDTYATDEVENCGEYEVHSLVFRGGTRTELEQGMNATVRLASGPINVMHVAAIDWKNTHGDCLHRGSRTEWIAWKSNWR